MILNKITIFLLLLIVPLFGWAQKNARATGNQQFTNSRPCQSSFNKVYLNTTNKEEVAAYLSKALNLKEKKIKLYINHQIESNVGTHLTFLQKIDTIPVYGSEIKVNMDKKGTITSIFDNSYPVESLNTPFEFPDSVTVLNYIKKNFESRFEFRSEKMLYFNGEEFIPVVRAEILEQRTYNATEILLDLHGELVYQKDMNYHYRLNTAASNNPDTTVNAKVFLPNPITTAHVSYGAPYMDYNDSDVVELNAQRKNVTINVNLVNDTFRLESPYVSILDFSEPIVPPVYSTTPNFYFTRHQKGFEDVNAYYHIYTMQKYIQSLGFTNIVNYPIQVDTHANSGGDNSSFSYLASPPRLLFGEGGVDDAEDADVIIHEYGHAISFSAAPNTNVGMERQTIDEANSDYFATSYRRTLDSFNWQNVFPWDGHNEFWSGRTAKTTKTYSDTTFKSIYTDADIWSSTLMQIWEDLGRTITDKLTIQSIYGYAQKMKMPEAARLFIQADSLLYGGIHYNSIFSRFVQRGILSQSLGVGENINDQTTIKIKNTFAFAQNKGALIIDFPSTTSASLKLYNISGQKLFEENYSSVNLISFDKALTTGVYFLQINTSGNNHTFKIIKY